MRPSEFQKFVFPFLIAQSEVCRLSFGFGFLDSTWQMSDPAETKKSKKKSSSSASSSAVTDGAVAEEIEAALRAHKKSALGGDIALKHTVQ